jgi:hypothetical protein
MNRLLDSLHQRFKLFHDSVVELMKLEKSLVIIGIGVAGFAARVLAEDNFDEVQRGLL